MLLQDINIGSAANDGTGDSPRAAGQKINTNFAEMRAKIEYIDGQVDLRIGGQDQRITDRFQSLDDYLAEQNSDLELFKQEISGLPTAAEQLAAIALTKALSAVDVFIYRTSKDSDGGAWRKRCQHTAWYNEPLNTALRGARREFPAVALIVLIDYNNILVFDLDDPTAPLWANIRNAIPGYTVTVMTKVRALNGRIFIASNVGYGGLGVLDLPADRNTWYGIGQGGDPTGTYVQSGWFTASLRPYLASANYTPGQALVNIWVNDIDMTVMPDAPIDPASGLPIPTVAAATNGGVSIIHPDGSIIDWVPPSSGICFGVTIRPGYLAVAGGGGVLYRNWVRTSIPTADSTSFDFRFAADSTPARMGADNRDGQPRAISKYRNIAAFGLTAGLNLLLPNEASFGGSMVAYVSAAFNTGWMVGAVKGAWLASKETANLMPGAELVTNGNFAAGATGWTETPTGTGSCDLTGGNAALTGVDTANRGLIRQNITTVVGRCYRVKWTVASGTVSSSFAVVDGVGGFSKSGGTVAGTYTGQFIALSTNPQIQISVYGAGTVVFDDISVVEAVADRSSIGLPLDITGTITRTAAAAGAELVGYSGFSAANYLEQRFNANLDFGSGDFCMMSWVKTALVSDTIAERGYYTGGAYNGARLMLYISSSGYPVLYAAGATSGADVLTGPVAINNGQWHLVAGLRRGSRLELWVDGVLVTTKVTIDSVGGFNNANAVLRVGTRVDGGDPNGGSLALLRISATAPSAEQVRKIYEDEKQLFQASAACTIYGTSDLVTALTHDNDNGLLHVGTSAGRSTFRGLRRVANTTIAVGAAIAAGNNLVADD